MAEVELEKVYFVDNFDGLASHFDSYKKILIVSGSGVEAQYGSQIYTSLNSKLKDADVHTIDIPSGEDAKSMQVVSILWDMFTRFNLDRSSLVLSVGGGSISDSVGFAASTYKRGIVFASVPTTILAADDASVGGKRAVNTKAGKNLIGSFYPASSVFINLSIFDSLTEEQKISGFCEVLKMAMLGDGPLYRNLQTVSTELDYSSDDFEEIVALAIKYKQNIVSQDYYDKKGVRAILNYGHSLGHAIESFENFSSPHGLCIALGMDFAAWNFSDEKVQKAQNELFVKYHIDEKIKELKAKIREQNIDQLIKYMLNDKKAINDDINFIYLKDIGQAGILTISSEQLRTSLLKYIKDGN